MKDPVGHFLEIEVRGAGKIRINSEPVWSCGDAIGFMFDTDWNKDHFSGGVLSREDAKILAEHILKSL